MKIGDKDFWRFWKTSRRKLDKEKARQVLSDLMHLAHMPDELSGSLNENQWLISRFADNLPPHHTFWRDLAQLVTQAFPKNSLSQMGKLERQIHQFRYVISSQQAQYIRKYYKKLGMTDTQALAVYLGSRSRFSYSLNASARLHNKVAIAQGAVVYPGGQESFNIKVLLNRSHTEFILSSQGNFLNELDAEEVTEAGIVNGASFNYGRGRQHWALDVKPIALHDPAFRKKWTTKYRSPKYIKKQLTHKLVDEAEHSYFNQSGLYAKDGHSYFEWVQREVQNFKRQIKAFSPSDNFLHSRYRRIKYGLKKIGKPSYRKQFFKVKKKQ